MSLTLFAYTVVTVMFARPSYTFVENGVVGSVEVVKDRALDSSFMVSVIGGVSWKIIIVAV